MYRSVTLKSISTISTSSGQLDYTINNDSLKFTVSMAAIIIPVFVNKVVNQNLHAIAPGRLCSIYKSCILGQAQPCTNSSVGRFVVVSIATTEQVWKRVFKRKTGYYCDTRFCSDGTDAVKFIRWVRGRIYCLATALFKIKEEDRYAFWKHIVCSCLGKSEFQENPTLSTVEIWWFFLDGWMIMKVIIWMQNADVGGVGRFPCSNCGRSYQRCE